MFPELTAREREVLALIADGVSNTGIAAKLSLGPKTVRNHVSCIFTKFHVADRARKAGLGDGHPPGFSDARVLNGTKTAPANTTLRRGSNKPAPFRSRPCPLVRRPIKLPP